MRHVMQCRAIPQVCASFCRLTFCFSSMSDTLNELSPDLMSNTAGLKGILSDTHPLRSKLAKNFAARIAFDFSVPAGGVLLRLKCPVASGGAGGIFANGQAVYRIEADPEGEV